MNRVLSTLVVRKSRLRWSTLEYWYLVAPGTVLLRKNVYANFHWRSRALILISLLSVLLLHYSFSLTSRADQLPRNQFEKSGMVRPNWGWWEHFLGSAIRFPHLTGDASWEIVTFSSLACSVSQTEIFGVWIGHVIAVELMTNGLILANIRWGWYVL